MLMFKSAFAAYLFFVLHSPLAAESLRSRISCINTNGVPLTVLSTKSGQQIQIINWKGETSSSSGWSAIRSCQKVSQRLQEHHDAGTLRYITTGRKNGMPILCISRTDRGGCSHLVYSLKPGTNATAKLRKLFGVNNSLRSSTVLEETTSRIYINIKKLLTNK